MSVIIKGKNKPTRCAECFMYQCGATGMDECPLVEIPPHGDLIDKQETDRLNRIDYEAYGSNDWTDYARFVFLNSLKAAPIIIEAEEGGDTNGD